MKRLKLVFPTVVGTVTGMVFISLGEWAIEQKFPFPAGIDMHNMQAVANAMRQMPQAAFACVFINYIIASFIAGVVATLVLKRVTLQPAIIVGIILTLAGLYNTLTLPHPLWFSIANICCYLPSAYLGGKAVMRKNNAPQ